MSIHPVHIAPRPLKLGFLCPHNPHDRRTFSGTPYFSARALAARPGVALRILGHRPPGRLDRLLRRPASRVDLDRIDVSDLDAVVGMVATDLLDQLARRHPMLPFLHVTDATPKFLSDAYGWRIPAEATAAEARVAAHAAAMVLSSRNIAARAPGDLGLPDLAPAVVPFGVNLEHLPELPARKPSLNKLNLLFVGVDWVRKGGDIAVATLDQLLAMDIDAHLTIVGRCPEKHRHHPAITYAGFLNKNRRKEARRLISLYARSHLLLLPSRADCTPMVVAEAMAHGTPVLASETGGIASQIAPGTGQILAPFAAPGDWAGAIYGLLRDREAYDMMSDACFDQARTRLSWTTWAGEIEHLARAAVTPVEAPVIPLAAVG